MEQHLLGEAQSGTTRLEVLDGATGRRSWSVELKGRIVAETLMRGGRKEVQLPPGAPVQRRTDSTLIKALARAFRWKRMLESGQFATINELAEHEGIAPSYMTRVLRLTLLSPDIVEAILDGRQGPEVTLRQLLEPFPVEWEGQGAMVQKRMSNGRLKRVDADALLHDVSNKAPHGPG